jgi:hypothetical protein
LALFFSFVAVLVALNYFFPSIRQIYFSFARNNHQGQTYILNHLPRLYGDHFVLICAHIFMGLLMILLWPLQFWTYLRSKFKKLHYFMGTLFFISAIGVGLTALLISFQIPFGGRGEAVVNLLVVSTFLFCLYRSALEVKKRNFREHKKWIIRTLSLALGIISQRFLFVHDVIFFPHLEAGDLFVLSAFLGFFGNLLIVEIGIRKLGI